MTPAADLAHQLAAVLHALQTDLADVDDHAALNRAGWLADLAEGLAERLVLAVEGTK